MRDTGGMRGGDSFRDLYGEVDHLPLRQLAPRAKRLAVYQLTDKEILANVVDGNDVRVIQSGHGTSFLLETFAAIRVAHKIVGQNLQGHVAIQPRVAGAINLAHSARS